ncbi:hypothetical protein RSOLAG1IB_11890 [Rhizoctonia solani AG-1 IB]|uniref:Uncharacterized protein n=1 Tax=Thanatephorus cucumeris (strain AG1-IB / isolate 7/3/14) TaxID=1108050 RepID=A0A0B7FH95_THACB|nr:hypothetical protein RSOLAG1IB_11890 [Rhizoctonia solani AG-1 IB]
MQSDLTNGTWGRRSLSALGQLPFSSRLLLSTTRFSTTLMVQSGSWRRQTLTDGISFSPSVIQVLSHIYQLIF